MKDYRYMLTLRYNTLHEPENYIGIQFFFCYVIWGLVVENL